MEAGKEKRKGERKITGRRREEGRKVKEFKESRGEMGNRKG